MKKRFWLRVPAFVLAAVLVLTMVSTLSACSKREQAQSGDIVGNDEAPEDGKQKFNKVYYDYFDTVSTIVGYEETQAEFDEKCEFIEKELKRYHELYDIYHSYSGVTNFYTMNKEAAKAPVRVDPDIIALLKFGREVYDITLGKTNFAMGSVLSIWHEYRDLGNYDPLAAALPTMEELRAAAQHCDIEDVVIDEEAGTVFYADPLLRLDVGAIAKGYATERITQDLIKMGANNYALNIGGNIRTIGAKSGGGGWVAGIQNPDLTSSETYLLKVSLAGKALVTSGSYQRYYYVDNVRYHHIIDPETLMPKDTFVSVSILNEDSGMADALSTACFNLSLEDGMALIASLPDTEAMWVEPDGREHYSEHFLDYCQTGR